MCRIAKQNYFETDIKVEITILLVFFDLSTSELLHNVFYCDMPCNDMLANLRGTPCSAIVVNNQNPVL